ncbi:MAG TPA: TonB-dependent receptor plug domain-containing protein, partial [Kineobactrum sp.]
MQRTLMAAAIAALLPATVYGQADRPLPMPVIEVIGKSEDAISRQTGSVVIIDRERLELLQPLSTEDALRRVPGINTKSEEETSIVANIGLRGLS